RWALRGSLPPDEKPDRPPRWRMNPWASNEVDMRVEDLSVLGCCGSRRWFSWCHHRCFWALDVPRSSKSKRHHDAKRPNALNACRSGGRNQPTTSVKPSQIVRQMLVILTLFLKRTPRSRTDLS